MSVPNHDFALERAAEELWNAIGYRNFNGVDNPFQEAAEKTDAGDPEYRLAGYVWSVRALARRTVAAYQESLRDREPSPSDEAIGREAERLCELFSSAAPDNDGVGCSWPHLVESERHQWRVVARAAIATLHERTGPLDENGAGVTA